jgi:hypothetical protein
VLNIAFRHTSEAETKNRSSIAIPTRISGREFQDVNKEAADLINDAQTKLGREFRIEGIPEIPKNTVCSMATRSPTCIVPVRPDARSSIWVMSTEAKSRLEVAGRLCSVKRRTGDQPRRWHSTDEKNATDWDLVSVEQVRRTLRNSNRTTERFASANAEYPRTNALAKEKTLLEDFRIRPSRRQEHAGQIAIMQDFFAQQGRHHGKSPKEELLKTQRLLTLCKTPHHDVASLDSRKKELQNWR